MPPGIQISPGYLALLVVNNYFFNLPPMKNIFCHQLEQAEYKATFKLPTMYNLQCIFGSHLDQNYKMYKFYLPYL